VVGRGEFEAKVTRINFHRLWVQRFSERLPRVMHSTNATGRAIISFHTQPGPDIVRSGVDVGPNSIARLGEDHSYFQRSSGLINWGAMSLPVEDMRAAGLAISGCDLTPLSDELILTPPPAAMANLQRLHAAAGDLAERAPEIIANADAARGLEQALTHSMVACLSTAEASEDVSAKRRHERIMRRVHTVIEQHSGDAIFLADLCAIAGVSERTLRVCCYESWGMGPKRYLLRRRMNLARQALRQAEAAETSVTEVATRYGFWQLGRFSVEYKALYGETPSTTLRSLAP
jgi:AraC-like DNA-binding protein